MSEKVGEAVRQRFSFNRKFPVFGIISLCFVLIGLVSVLLLPFGVTLLNLDVDFTGGTSLHYATHVYMDVGELDTVRAIAEEVTGQPASAPQRSGADGTEVIIKTTEMSSEQRQLFFEKMQAAFSGITDGDVLAVDNISSVVGNDLRNAAILSIVLAVVLILLYITIRFQFVSGVAAVIGLMHDLCILVSFYVIFQIPVNMNFIAVMLTILGYSINATIIVFDRVRENQKFMPKSAFPDVVDRSIHQTLLRTVNTTVTTLLPVIMIIILGVPSVQNFILPLGAGILVGTYCSICVVGPVWTRFRGIGDKRKAAKKAVKA